MFRQKNISVSNFSVGSFFACGSAALRFLRLFVAYHAASTRPAAVGAGGGAGAVGGFGVGVAGAGLGVVAAFALASASALAFASALTLSAAKRLSTSADSEG